MTLHRHGHGALLRDDAIALPHVGYWVVEHRRASIWTISGEVRGDAKALEALSRAGHELLLVLDNGIRLPILLTESHKDDLTWEFQSTTAYPSLLRR
jgi:hypothetical protein